MLALIAALALATAAEAEAQPVTFAPLKGAELRFAKLGPAGPFYPALAADQGVSGSAVIECDVDTVGALSACVLVEETPQNKGFGPAALLMAGRGRLSAWAPPAEAARLRLLVPFSPKMSSVSR